MRLSEKVLEQRLERGFDRHTEGGKGLRVLCSATLQASATLFGQSRKVNSAKFAGRGFSELPRRPSENCYIRGIRFLQGGPTRRGSMALLSLEEGEEQMISTVASKVMRVGERSS
jgi:fructose-bisphosphate aldolase class 1